MASSSSSSSAQLRLMSDLKSIINEPPEGCSASPVSDDNLFVWSATIFGPEDSPWEGGVFSLRLIFGDNYPGKPPRVRFTSDMFHPNVYHDGTLCMDIIQDAWSPCHNVSTILTSIQSLLTDPNPASPANPEAAQLYQHDVQAYNKGGYADVLVDQSTHDTNQTHIRQLASEALDENEFCVEKLTKETF